MVIVFTIPLLVLIQGDESANLVLRLSVNNALHNKWVICKQWCILS